MRSKYDIIKYVLECGSDSLSVFGGTWEGGYRIQQDPIEITEALSYLSNFGYRNYLEIGSAGGGTTRLMIEMLEIKNSYIIDDNQHPASSFRKELLDGLNVREFAGDSHSEECEHFLDVIDDKFDIVFIDGDHSYEGVVMDTRLVFPRVHHGGIVMFHDVEYHPGVKRYMEELKEKKELIHLKTIVNRKSDHIKGISLFMKP